MTTPTTEELLRRFRRDREHHAYLAAHSAEIDPETARNALKLGSERMRDAEIASPTPAMVEAAARAMYETQPRRTDPAWWETPWDELPAQWQAGQKAAARRVLQAAKEAGQ